VKLAKILQKLAKKFKFVTRWFENLPKMDKLAKTVRIRDEFVRKLAEKGKLAKKV
jgi:hypothetical protein